MSLVNLTPYAATLVPTVDHRGCELALIVVAARFAFPPDATTRPAPTPEQPAAPLADVYPGEPGVGGPIRAGQAAFTRPGGDVYVCGSVQAPEPTAELAIDLRVADEIHVRAWVFGDRRWTRGLTGWTIGAPRPFATMPIDWSRCAGHVDELRNPAGCHPPRAITAGDPLPNFEAPDARITGPRSPAVPLGLGPIPPHWQPRRALAGTYDARWQQQRAPHWPEDLDLRFFGCAPPQRQRPAAFVGGEAVAMIGLLPRPTRFCLPRLRVQLKLDQTHRRDIERVRFDCLELDLDARCLTLFGRAGVLLDRGFGAFEEAVVRELRDWEAEA